MDVSNTRLGAWDVTWTAAGGSPVNLGAVDDVTPDLVIETADVQVGSMGKAILGKRIIGLSGSVKITARESVATTYQNLMAWWTSGSIPLLPAAPNTDLYDYAGLLTLHPTEMGSDHSLDISLIKASPVITPPARDGTKEDQITVEFFPFPDRDQFPNWVYGYIGPVPG